MTTFAKLGAEIFRRYETDAVPASGAHEVDKTDMRAWMTTVEEELAEQENTLHIINGNTGADPVTVLATNASFASSLLRLEVNRIEWIDGTNPEFNYMVLRGDIDGTAINVFKVDGAGNVGQGTAVANPGGFSRAYTMNASVGGQAAFVLAVAGTLKGLLFADATTVTVGGAASIPLYFRADNTEYGVLGTSGGLVWGVAATGGDKGVGTINVSGNVYKNNAPYTNPDFVFEHFYNDRKIEKFIDNPGARDYRGLMPLPELRDYTREHLRLPGITDEPMGVFDRGDFALRIAEEQTLYLLQLEDMIRELEAQ